MKETNLLTQTQTNRGARREPIRADSPELHPPPQDEDSEDTTSNAEQQELADAVIPHLTVANDPIVAAVEWANTNMEDNAGSVSAFAKVCGRDWTYYVKRLSVNIGRPPDTLSRQGTGHGAEPSPANIKDDSAIHIDLGPSKLVSRLHAELAFNHDDFKWHVAVHGRNGVKVNDTAFRRGQKTTIDSGDVLEIGGTQMMFVGASGQAVIHPMFLEKLHRGLREEPDPRAIDNQAHFHSEGSGPSGHPPSSSQALSGARSRVNGQAVIAPAPPNFVRQTTPEMSLRRAVQMGSGKKRSPAFGRGIVIETNELIDYSSDSAKEIKPGLSYATMISQAILSTPEQYLSLKGIYAWIAANFSYYRHLKTNWQACQASSPQ